MPRHIHCYIHYGSGSTTGDRSTFGAMDEVRHDPHSGQFMAVAEHHEKVAAHHERLATEREGGQHIGRVDPGAHRTAAKVHMQAAQSNRRAAERGRGFAGPAREHTIHANKFSRRIGINPHKV